MENGVRPEKDQFSGAYIATGHVNSEVNLWHASAGHILIYKPRSARKVSYNIDSVQLVRNKNDSMVIQENGSSSHQQNGGSMNAKGSYDVSSYHLFYAVGGKIYRLALDAFNRKRCADYGAFTRIFVKGQVMIIWGDHPPEHLQVCQISERRVQKHYTVTHPYSQISSLGVWKTKVKALLVDRSIVEFDLGHDEPHWSACSTRWSRKPTDKEFFLRSSCQYAGIVHLGITDARNIWIATDEQETIIDVRNLTGDPAGATSVLLHGSLFAVGTEAGRVWLYYIGTLCELFNSEFGQPLTTVSLSSEPVIYLGVLDGLVPMLAAAIVSRVYMLRFLDLNNENGFL